jgi:hypothetical protein
MMPDVTPVGHVHLLVAWIVTSCCLNGGYQLFGGVCCLHSTVWIQQGQPTNYEAKGGDLHLGQMAPCKIEAFLLMNGTTGTWGSYVYGQVARNVPWRLQGDIRMSHFLHNFPIAPFCILSAFSGPHFKPNYMYNLYSIQPCTMELEYSSERE